MPVLRVRSGPQQGMQWRLSRSVAARIGSDPSCEICITGDGVERRQAVVHYVTGRWLIESLGSAGLRINDNAPAHLAWLEPDDRIQLLPGSVVVEFLSTSLKRAKGRHTPTGRTSTFAKLLPGIAGSSAGDAQPKLADDVRKRMFWPALACGGIVAVSAITALAVVVLAGMVLLRQQERRAESHADGPLASKTSSTTPQEAPPSTAKTEGKDEKAPPETKQTPDTAPPQTPIATPPASTTPPSTAVASATPSTTNPPTTPPPGTNPTPTPSVPTVPVLEPGSEQFWKLFEAGVFLIEVTNPGTKQTAPFGAAWAAGDVQLVTTAGQAIELANFLKEGWRVVVVRQSDQGRVAVKQAVAHPEYEKLTGQRMQMFYDVGLLTIENSTMLAFELPGSADYDHLEAGAAVTCLGIPNGFDPMVSATSLKVKAFPGKLQLLERLKEGGPALLHLNIELPEHVEGSPIFTAQGKVVGIYNRSAPADVQKKIGFPLHAATSVLPVRDLLPTAAPAE